MKTWLSVLICILGLVVAATGCWIDYRYSFEVALFQRFGALTVLAGAIAEYRLVILSRRHVSPKGAVSISELQAATADTPEHARARFLAHATVIFGTLIWAFGDLVR